MLRREPSAEGWREAGNAAFRRGEFLESVKSYVRALKQQRDDHCSWANLSQSFAELGEWGRSAEAAWLCVAFRPGFAKGHWRLGRASLRLGRPRCARLAAAAGLSAQPGHSALRRLELEASGLIGAAAAPAERAGGALDCGLLCEAGARTMLGFLLDAEVLAVLMASPSLLQVAGNVCLGRSNSVVFPVGGGSSGSWQVFGPLELAMLIRVTRGVHVCSPIVVSGKEELIRLSAAAWMMSTWVQDRPNRSAYLDAFAFHPRELQMSRGRAFEHGAKDDIYDCSNLSFLREDGPVVRLTYCDLRPSYPDEQTVSVTIEPDQRTDYELGTRVVHAISPDFEGFYSETRLTDPGGAEHDAYEFDPDGGSAFANAIFAGRPCLMIFGVESSPPACVQCRCGAIAVCTSSGRSNGCAICGHTTIEEENHINPRLFFEMKFQCPTCGHLEMCHRCIQKAQVDALWREHRSAEAWPSL